MKPAFEKQEQGMAVMPRGRTWIRRVIFLGLLPTLAAVSGCVDLDVLIRLAEDGSGEMDLRYSLFVPAEDDYARFASILEYHPKELLVDPRAEIQPKHLNRDVFEPHCIRRGVEILNCTRVVDGEWDTAELSLKFSHVDSLSLAFVSATKRLSGSFQIAEMQDGSFLLMFDRSIPPTELFWQWFPDSPQFPERADAGLDSIIESSKEYAAGYLMARGEYLSSLFKAKLVMELPAVPVRHNATILEGPRCTWEFGPQDIYSYKLTVSPFAQFPGTGLSIIATRSRK